MSPCKLCGKTALYQVPSPKGSQFFCGTHKKEATARIIAEGVRNEQARNLEELLWHPSPR